MKMTFSKPEMEIQNFTAEDIITTSGNGSNIGTDAANYNTGSISYNNFDRAASVMIF